MAHDFVLKLPVHSVCVCECVYVRAWMVIGGYNADIGISFEPKTFNDHQSAKCSFCTRCR